MIDHRDIGHYVKNSFEAYTKPIHYEKKKIMRINIISHSHRKKMHYSFIIPQASGMIK